MKRKRNLIIGGAALVIIFFVGYNIYRYPAMFRNLSDKIVGRAPGKGAEGGNSFSIG